MSTKRVRSASSVISTGQPSGKGFGDVAIIRSAGLSVFLLVALLQMAEAATPQQTSGITVDVSPAGMSLSIENMTLKGALYAFSTKADFEIIGFETIAEKSIQRATLHGQPEQVFARLLRGYSYILQYRETGRQKSDPNRLNVARLIVVGPDGVKPSDDNYNMDTMVRAAQTPAVVGNGPPKNYAHQSPTNSGHQAATSSGAGQIAGLLTKQAILQTLPVSPHATAGSGASGSKASVSGNAAPAPVSVAGWKPEPGVMANMAQLTRTAVQGTEALVQGLELAQRTHLDAQRTHLEEQPRISRHSKGRL